MKQEIHEILGKVRDGELSPEEAERLIREGSEPQPSPEPDVKRVRVIVGVGGVEILGDPKIVQAEVEGPHAVRVEGDTFVVTSRQEASIAEAFGFKFSRPHVKVQFGRGPGAGERGGRLIVRMNPGLMLDVDVDAGPVSISDVRGPIGARVSAGPLSVDGFRGPLDLTVNAGAIRARGLLDSGTSKVRCDAGAIRLTLERGSSVRVIASAGVGKVVLPDGTRTKGLDAGERETVVGAGEATLRVETAMGSINVSEER